MQAKDIPDATFLEAVRKLQSVWRWNPFLGRAITGPASVWDLANTLQASDKVVRAKARRLIRRGLLDGCPCGCRGDFTTLG